MIEIVGSDHATARVVFRIPDVCASEGASVVGEFNDWSESATPMRHDGDSFVAELTLPRGRTYRFRYLLDGVRWENDWAAHAYVPNEFGGDDSLLDLSAFDDAASAPPAARQRTSSPSRRRAQARTKKVPG